MNSKDRQDLEFQKFVETTGGRVAIGLVLDPDSFNIFNARYIQVDTGTVVANATGAGDVVDRLNELLTQLRTAKLLAPTT